MAQQNGRELNKSDVSFSAESNAALPSVTISMLADFLSNSKIEHQPSHVRRIFHWFSAISFEGVASTIPSSVVDANLLFVCDANNAISLLEDKPQAFAIVLARDDEVNDLINNLEFAANRTIIIKQTNRFSYFLFQLQSYFTSLLIWENELSRIAAQQGTLTEMLNATTLVINNFIFISDSNFNIIASTTHIAPPDDLHRRMMSTGCLTPQMIKEKRKKLPEDKHYIKKPSSLTPFARLSHPLYFNHMYFGSLSMSCNNMPLTDGLKDMFDILMKHIAPACAILWRTQMKLEMPYYFFFEKILKNTPISSKYLHSQMELIGLNEHTEFKLIALEIDNNVEPRRATLAIQAANYINHGHVFCFPHEKLILVLCHTPPSDNKLSHLKTIEELDQRIYRPYGIISGVSEVFIGIENLDLAYRQTKIALGLKDTIAREAFATERDGRKEGIYLFADALLYYLVDPGHKDERFMKFCFSHTILTKLYQEDKRSGTNCLALFWFYLYYDRNATAVANRLHMHRNTVLYHIDKIQKRFDFDLSLRIARDRMMLDFKVFFLTMGDESIAQILAESRDTSTESK